MKTKKEQRKKEKKQTSKPQDLVPKKDAKGGWGVGGTTPMGVPPPKVVGLNSRGALVNSRFAFLRAEGSNRDRTAQKSSP